MPGQTSRRDHRARELRRLAQGTGEAEVISKFKKALKHLVKVALDERYSDECAI